jgi:hypothetical protein
VALGLAHLALQAWAGATAMSLLLLPRSASADRLEQPAAPAMQPVTDSLFGHRVTDPYRYFESQDARVADWIEAQGAYTRSLLDSIKPHATMS